MKLNPINLFLLSVFVITLLASNTFGKSIRYTKHNLSISGPGSIKANSEKQICLFCHTPKKSRKNFRFLWNRKTKVVRYTPYQSSTLYSTVDQPSGSSRVCLSCHDGTIALGALLSGQKEMKFKGGLRFIPPHSPARLGTDLSDDHPVSFVYDAYLAANRGELTQPSQLPLIVKLDKNGQLQCTSCHDPHDETFDKFLVMSNQYSGLCLACHQIEGWAISAHAASNARWNGQGTDPWPNTDYQTVAENGCGNCHRPHTAGKPERLLKYAFEEDNCLICHGNKRVATMDIETELTKPFRHAVQDYTGIHDTAEDFTSENTPKHVECEDCHNPHQVNDSISSDPNMVSSVNIAVKGITSGGQQVGDSRYVYEICFKCHAGNNVLWELPITRQIAQLNVSLEFNPANPSFHPVETVGLNPDVPSLLPPYTINSIISCTNCHNSDNPSGPQGPHGSSFEFILAKNYETKDFTKENSINYALCYKCHSRNSILSDASFSKHKKHIVDQNTPCAACHDPHGISSTQGSSANNSHLINFDLTIVQPDSLGNMYFQDLGRFTGQCFLKCHGKTHAAEIYP